MTKYGYFTDYCGANTSGCSCKGEDYGKYWASAGERPLIRQKLELNRQRLADSRLKKGRIPIPAKYDSIYFDALHTMNEEELRPTYVPPGYPITGVIEGKGGGDNDLTECPIDVV